MVFGTTYNPTHGHGIAMYKTAEQRAADKALEQAIIQSCQAYDILKDPELGEPMMLGDYVCIVEGLKFDGDGDLVSDFLGLVFPNGTLSTSKSKGLIGNALDMLRFGRKL